MRLIDADALKAKMHRRHDLFSGCTYPPEVARRDELSQMIVDIIDEPTVDAIPMEFIDRMIAEGTPEESKGAWQVEKAWKEGARK